MKAFNLQSLPIVPFGTSTRNSINVLLWCDDPSVEARLRSTIGGERGVDVLASPGGVIAFNLDDAARIAHILRQELSTDERQPIKTLTFTGDRPALADFAAIKSADEMILDHQEGMVAELIAERRYRSLMQPIVSSDMTQVHGYEFLFRGVDHTGDQLSPMELFDVARREGMTNDLDRVAAISAVDTCARLGLGQRIFVNLLPSTLMMGRESLRPMEQAINDSGISPEQIVIELVEVEAMEDIDAIVDLVETGETLKQNGLVELEHIVDVSSVVIANRVGLKLRRRSIEPLLEALRS